MAEHFDSEKVRIESLHSVGHQLIDDCNVSAFCQQDVRDSLSSISQHCEELLHQTNLLEVLMQDMLSQWTRYHKELDLINDFLIEVEYMLNHYKQIGPHVSNLSDQLQKLKVTDLIDC